MDQSNFCRGHVDFRRGVYKEDAEEIVLSEVPADFREGSPQISTDEAAECAENAGT